MKALRAELSRRDAAEGQKEKELLEHFEYDLRHEWFVFRIKPTFKRRHFKKALRKKSDGKLLTLNEWCFVLPEYGMLPQRDMDGDIFYVPEGTQQRMYNRYCSDHLSPREQEQAIYDLQQEANPMYDEVMINPDGEK